jgi:alkanesulfonate monooxygenase SsuD/methylene tetrahydromethanopterin reductase-like flavin-dependent oxidoreductase (luciferase family)
MSEEVTPGYDPAVLPEPVTDPVRPATGPLGLILPTFPQESDSVPTAAELAQTCARAEAAGAGALWACDHLYWHRPVVECFATLAVAAAATTRAAIGPCVLQLPLRDQALVAKQAASLWDLSGGRLILGVGVGSHEGEYQAVGAAYHERGRRLDMMMDALRASWSATEGRYRILPAPPQIPLWVGGSSEPALRRAAERAQGWIPLFVPPEEYGAACRRLDKETQLAGRDPASVTRGITAFVSLAGNESEEAASRAADRGCSWMGSLYGLPPKAFARHLLSGSARRCAEHLARWYEAGAEHVACFITEDAPLVAFEALAGALADRGVVPGSSPVDTVAGPSSAFVGGFAGARGTG